VAALRRCGGWKHVWALALKHAHLHVSGKGFGIMLHGRLALLPSCNWGALSAQRTDLCQQRARATPRLAATSGQAAGCRTLIAKTAALCSGCLRI